MRLAILKYWANLFCLFFIFLPLLAKEQNKNLKPGKTKVIIVSIDGFLGNYFASPEILNLIPNLKQFSEESAFSHEVQTVNPSVTYPAHTSMVTGVDPGTHGIYNNTILDPFEKNDGGWTWYAEDIQVPTLWDLAKQRGKKIANVFWPVTVGAEIDYNLPQYWRKKIPEDDKLLRALSTKGLHRMAELKIGAPINDTTKDQVKFKTAYWLFETYEPDLMLVYSTDLDTVQHGYGVYSEQAKQKLKEIDFLFGDFLNRLKLYERKDLALILISDHGFFSARKTCSPNLYLLQKGFIRTESQDFDFIFKSSGGSALLLPGIRKPTEEELLAIREDILKICPGVKWSESSKELDLRSQHPDAIAWLSTSEEIFFSGTRKGEIFSEHKNLIHGHGYDKNNKEMLTIGGVYWKGIKDEEAWKMSSVKDVFFRAQSLLDLHAERKRKKKN